MWSSLRALGQFKFVNTTLLWIAITPAIVSVFQRLDKIVEIELFGKLFELNLELPFSWLLLYFAAILFVSGSITFRIFCPLIIQECKDFGEFERRGMDYWEAIRYLKLEVKEDELFEYAKSLIRPSLNDELGNNGGLGVERFTSWEKIESEVELTSALDRNTNNVHVVELFWGIYRKADRGKIWLRAFVGFQYSLGLMFLFGVFLQGFGAVMKIAYQNGHLI